MGTLLIILVVLLIALGVAIYFIMRLRQSLKEVSTAMDINRRAVEIVVDKVVESIRYPAEPKVWINNCKMLKEAYKEHGGAGFTDEVEKKANFKAYSMLLKKLS